MSVLTPHTCPRITYAKSPLGHSVKFLSSNGRSRVIVTEDRDIKPKQLVSEERLDRENKINYQQAHRLREKLRDDIFGDELLSFSKMPALIKKMQSSAYAGLQVDEHSRFQRALVLPKASENAMLYLRNFAAMDGAHCTSRHRLVLAVTSLDGEEEILVLAWALVPVEDRADWLWFLRKIAPPLTRRCGHQYYELFDRDIWMFHAEKLFTSLLIRPLLNFFFLFWLSSAAERRPQTLNIIIK